MTKNAAQQLLAEWNRILPPCVKISCGDINDFCQSLTELERVSIGDATTLRMQEFSSGRKHAHLALSAIKAEATNIPKCHQSKKPIWPKNIVGSITHASSKKCSHVAVAVANISDLKNLGIDAEIDLNLHPKLWHQFLTKDELSDLLRSPIALRNNLVNIIWCLKESAIKASGVTDVLKISSKAVNVTTGTYEVLVTTPSNQLLMTGIGVNVCGVTLAAVYLEHN